MLAQRLGTPEGMREAWARCAKKAADADFALVELPWPEDEPTSAPVSNPASEPAPQVRLMDAVAHDYYGHLAVMELTGRELLQQAEILDTTMKEDNFAFLSDPRTVKVQPERVYRVVMDTWSIGGYCRRTRTLPDSFCLLDIPIREALQRHLADSDN